MKIYQPLSMKYYIGILVTVLVSYKVNAQNCNRDINRTAPDTRYEVNGQLVTDLQTGLIWSRCLLSQRYNAQSNQCEEVKYGFRWSGALVRAEEDMTANQSDWRVPNIKELASLVELACYNPAINIDVFPNTPNGFFWSSSVVPGSSSAWMVDFFGGSDATKDRAGTGYVRLVRSGQ